MLDWGRFLQCRLPGRVQTQPLASITSLSPHCVRGTGAAVDWWIVMKKAFGLGYMYVDNRINNFVVSRHSLGSANEGAVSRTLNATMQHSFAFFNAHSPTGGAYVCLLRLPAPAATACGCA